MINLIYAKSSDGLIGIDNRLPWTKQKSDMNRFKDITTNHIVIMGRKTFESIGKPLPNRLNIVITSKDKSELRDSDFITTFKTLQEAIEWASTKSQDFFKIFIIGGSQIYNEALKLDAENKINLDLILETEICTTVNLENNEKVVYSPKLPECWKLSTRQFYTADENNEFDYVFSSYTKSFM